jgi:hypothetical protein
MKTIKDIHKFIEGFPIKEGDKVAITFGTEFQQEIAHKVAEIVNCKGAKPIMVYVPISYEADKGDESCFTKEDELFPMLNADIWIKL